MKPTRIKILSASVRVATLGILIPALPAEANSKQPYKPTSPETVLMKVDVNTSGLPPSELRGMARKLQQNPDNIELAMEVAEAYLRLAKEQREPRYYGSAEAALKPFWTNPNTPQVLAVKADILQFSHKFDEAVSALETYLSSFPMDVNARQQLLTIYLVQGKFSQSAEQCGMLGRGFGQQIATCKAIAQSFMGNAKQSLDLLATFATLGVDGPQRGWMMANMAEIAERIGDPRAEQFYLEGLRATPANTFLLTLYADFLVGKGDHQKAFEILEPFAYDDAVLIRLAILAKNLNRPDAEKWHLLIKENFAAVRDRGTPVHQREEALYYLKIEDNPKRALELAKENWNIQKEPLDAIILAQSALAAGDQKQLANLAAWQSSTSYEDNRLSDLLKEVQQ